MKSIWPIVRVDEIKADNKSISLGPFGSNLTRDNYVQEGVPVIQGHNLSEGRFKDYDFVFVTQDKANQLSKSLAYPGDIIFTYKGTLGQVGIIPKNAKYKRYVVSQSQMKLSCNLDKSYPPYVYYFFKSKAGQNALLANSSSTGSPGINQPTKTLKEIQLPLPDLPEQIRIANMLGCIDEKIELIQEMNLVLVSMPRAIFKSWFVDFDPVWAKAEGKLTFGMDKETAALFPSAFEDTELGATPKGWSIKTIGEMADVVGGSTPSTKEPAYWGGEYYFVTPKDMSALKSPFVLGSERQITEKGLECISSGLLPIGTVLMSSRAPIGYLAIAEVPVSINQGIIAMVPNGRLPTSYLLSWTKSNMDTILNNANGTTFQEISKSNFRPIKMVVPPREIIERFEAIVTPLNAMIVNNLKETAALTALRDTLLPKLLSGEIRLGAIPREAEV